MQHNQGHYFLLKTCMLSMLLFSAFSSFGQKIEKDKIYFLSAEQTRGTFQLQATDENYCNFIVTGEIMEEIEKKRHTSDITFIKINETCRIKIYPASMISELRKHPVNSCIVLENFESE
jgi:hypothetical protein